MSYVVTMFYCPICDQIYSPPGTRMPDLPQADRSLSCEDCGGGLVAYESHDTAMEEGCRLERAFGDGNDVGG